MSLKALISNTLKGIVDSETLGELINVYKYTTHTSQNTYKQGPREFAAAVSLRGIVGYNPTPDELNKIGIGQDADVKGMITFTRLHLNAAFPGAEISTAVSRNDEVEFNSIRYRVVETWPGGVYSDEPEVLMVAFMEKP
jgi:hypothetical protein